MQAAQIERRGRISVDIPVTIISVLASTDAVMANLNEHGALIRGCALAVGASLQIDYPGQTLYAQCRWSEIDRMGVQFISPLVDGPLLDWLLTDRTPRRACPESVVMPFPAIGTHQRGGRPAAPRVLSATFGRRTG